MIKRLFIGVVLSGLFGGLCAQIDTEFWFAAPDITEGHGHTPILLCFASFNDPADVTLTQPANPSFQPITVHLNSFDFYSLDLTNFESILETTPENTVTNYGLKVVSSRKIAAYYQLCDPNSEIYTLKGRNALGTHFIVPMQNTMSLGSYYPEPRSSIEIVATQDNTTVTIIPGNAISGSTANPIVVTLNAGQTYSIRSVDIQASSHLGNTVIYSDKPIAVNSTDDSVYYPSGAADLAADQIVPVDYAGNLFAAIWAEPYYDYETVTIFPTQNNTQIFIDGNTTPVATINVGQQYVYHRSVNMSAAMTMISTDKPVLVWQLSGYLGEIGATQLPALECTGSKEVVYGRSNYSTDIIAYIVTETANISSFTIQCSNSSATLTAADFTQVPYNPAWSYCLKNFSSDVNNGSVMRVSNSLGKFHLGVLDYGGGTTTLGYFCAYNNGGRIVFTLDEGHCSHSEVALTYFADDADSIQFITPTGAVLFQDSLTINDFTLADTGMYYIRALSTIGCDSTAWISDSIRLYLLPCEEPPLPDNVMDPDCVFPPDSNAFDMQLLFQCPEVNSMSTPMVADMDGDGLPEIIACCYTYDAPWFSSGFHVVNGQTGALKYTIPTVQYHNHGQQVTIADVDQDGTAELFLLGRDRHLYCYNYNGGVRWTSTNTIDDNYLLSAADINNDGNAEIVCGKYIYNAQTGVLLLQGTMVETGMGYGDPHGYNLTFHPPYYMYALGDVDGDGTLELCAGNTIYKISINNISGATGNQWTILRQADYVAELVNYDGQTFLVDFDKDGDLDVCVIGIPHFSEESVGYNVLNPYVLNTYVWNGQNSDVIAYNTYQINNAYGGASIPYSGDLNGDNYPEIIFAVSDVGMLVYTYDPSSANHMSLLHCHVPFGETSGFTVFDFNQDGHNEIVYRGTQQLYIVDGVTLQGLCTPITAYSGTVTEYPVVADVNADGHAEIVVTQAYNDWSSGDANGWVSVYGSQIPGAWSSARRVWNQWAYNSVNINEDMTVPHYRFDISTIFPNGKQPFNSFLRQMPYIDTQGNLFNPVPDVAMNTSISSQMVGDSLVLTFSYCNLGDNMLNAPYPVTVFANTYGGDTLGTVIIGDNLSVDSCTQGEIHLAATDLCSHQNLNTLVVAVNCAGNGIAQNGGLQPECDTTNNTASVAIESLTISVLLTEQACDSYTWDGTTYNSSGSYTTSYTNEYGCASIVTLLLTIHPSLEIEDYLTLCENQLPYTYGDTVFAPGTPPSATFVLHRFTSAGCDSIVTLHLTVNPTGLTEYYDSVCQNTIYSGYGFSLSEDETATSGPHIFDRTLTNQFGCDSIIRLNLYVKPVITPEFYANPDRAMLSENPMIYFVNNTNIVQLGQANYYWVWDFGDGASDTTSEAENSHLYTNWDDYTVTLTLWADGCMDAASVSVFIEADLEFPNVITPNGDGINDVFVIKNLNPDRPNKLYISDRWGKAVWHKDNYQTYMKDGQIYNAESGFGMGNISDGVYYYTFYYEGAVRTIKFNGSITVIK